MYPAFNAQPESLRITSVELPADIEPKVRDVVWFNLVLGGDPPDVAIEWIEESFDLSSPDAHAIVAELAQARFTQQQALGEVSVPLRDAFAELEQRGIIARENFSCCPTCLTVEIGDERPTEGTWYGYVAYTNQAAEQLVEFGQCYLQFGVFAAAYMSRAEFDAMVGDQYADWYEPKAIELVTEVILPVLRSHGVQADWNNQMGHSIRVSDASYYHALSPAELAEFEND